MQPALKDTSPDNLLIWYLNQDLVECYITALHDSMDLYRRYDLLKGMSRYVMTRCVDLAVDSNNLEILQIFHDNLFPFNDYCVISAIRNDNLISFQFLLDKGFKIKDIHHNIAIQNKSYKILNYFKDNNIKEPIFKKRENRFNLRRNINQNNKCVRDNFNFKDNKQQKIEDVSTENDPTENDSNEYDPEQYDLFSNYINRARDA